MLILPRGFPLICDRAMCTSDAPHSLISYKDLQASNIHISTTLDKDEKVMELWQGESLLATANAGDERLNIIINKVMTKSPISLTDAKNVCITAWAEDPELRIRNLATRVSKDTTAKPDMWHRRKGHSGVAIFRQMLSLTVGHNLNSSHAHKTHECIVCIQ